MGNRLSKIVTRTGDAGTTGLGDGRRVAKDCLRINAIGEVDELNSSLGVLLAEALPENVRAPLLAIQNDLFDLGGELCLPDAKILDENYVARLEGLVAEFNDPLPPLKNFILPGGTRAAALAHFARAICRRAERSLVTLASDEAVSDNARRYLNRLSDLLFVLGRSLTTGTGGADTLWVPRERRNGE